MSESIDETNQNDYRHLPFCGLSLCALSAFGEKKISLEEAQRGVFRIPVDICNGYDIFVF